MLEQLQARPMLYNTRYTVRFSGIRKSEKIAVHCTVCGAEMKEILEKSLMMQEYILKKNNFSDTGGFGLGIQQHINLGMKYDPNICIYDLDFYVVMCRPSSSITDKQCRAGTFGPNTESAKKRPRAGSSRRMVDFSFLANKLPFPPKRTTKCLQ